MSAIIRSKDERALAAEGLYQGTDLSVPYHALSPFHLERRPKELRD
jgi:hypothetical protein